MKIITLYNKSTPVDVISAHKMVTNHFNLKVDYIVTELNHANAMELEIKKHQGIPLLFMDIDCIPLVPLEDIIQSDTYYDLIAPVQCANHTAIQKNYGGVFFWYFNPTEFCDVRLNETSFFDVGGLFWHNYNKTKKQLIPFISSNNDRWLFEDRTTYFGNGSIYGFDNKPMVYHQFEIGRGTIENRNEFITKCSQVILCNP